MFTSNEDIQAYMNQLRSKYNQARDKQKDRVDSNRPVDENSSMFGVNLPFLNLSQASKVVSSNKSLLNNSAIGPLKFTAENISNVMGEEVYYIEVSKPKSPRNAPVNDEGTLSLEENKENWSLKEQSVKDIEGLAKSQYLEEGIGNSSKNLK